MGGLRGPTGPLVTAACTQCQTDTSTPAGHPGDHKLALFRTPSMYYHSQAYNSRGAHRHQPAGTEGKRAPGSKGTCPHHRATLGPGPHGHRAEDVPLDTATQATHRADVQPQKRPGATHWGQHPQGACQLAPFTQQHPRCPEGVWGLTWITLPYLTMSPCTFLFSVSFCFCSIWAACCADT